MIALSLGICAGIIQIPSLAAAKSYRFGAWKVQLHQDRFKAVNYCKLYGNQIAYRHGVVYFQFQRNVDAENAWYRFDGGEAAPVAMFRRQVAQLTPFPEPAPLENPSNAQSSVPAEVVQTLGTVDIRPNAHARVKHFRVDGLSPALAFMTERNCRPFQE